MSSMMGIPQTKLPADNSAPSASPAYTAPPPDTSRLSDGRIDMTKYYNTQLAADQESRFQAWIKESGRQGDLADYDLRGWYSKSGQVATNGHLTDEFKKPNHPTFSSGSIYNGADGARGGEWIKSGDKWAFKATDTNVRNLGAQGLRSYFERVEPGNELLLPKE